jgi:hypothetical protein
MQSNQLPAELRERVESAIAALDYRVTVGQVAARAGVKLSDADKALKAIAYDSLAALEVNSQLCHMLMLCCKPLPLAKFNDAPSGCLAACLSS